MSSSFKNTDPKVQKLNLKEREKTNKNENDRKDKDQTFSLKVVANPGDPGTTEDTHFDILSRFVICEKESANRVVTNDKFGKVFYLVKRPEHLWISCEGPPDTKANDYQGTRRKDYSGNISVGRAGFYSINTIPKINRPYTVGEILTCRKLVQHETPHETDFFVSAFGYDTYGEFDKLYGGVGHKGNKDKIAIAPTDEAKYSDGFWSDYGPPSSVKVVDGVIYNSLTQKEIKRNTADDLWKQLKPLYPADSSYMAPKAIGTCSIINPHTKKIIFHEMECRNFGGFWTPPNPSRTMNDPAVGEHHYWMILHYYLYHYALGICNPDNASTVDRLRSGTQKYQGNGVDPDGVAYPDLMARQGGFLGQNILKTCVVMEDTNTDNKQRLTLDECMPLVIASPNQFPTPKTRQAGAILYQPSYSVVADQQNLNP